MIEELARGYGRVTLGQRFGGPADFDMASLTLEQAYRVQTLAAGHKQRAGLSPAGWKVGCTSPAIRAQLGLSEPIHAPMYHPLVHQEGAAFSRADFLNLAIEPELVICLGADIDCPPQHPDQLLPAIKWLAPGIELHHKHFFYKPVTSQELVASGGLWAGLLVGAKMPGPAWPDLNQARFKVLFNGRELARAPGRDIMGGPLSSLLWLARRRAQAGAPLKKGDLVIPGSPTELIALTQPGLLRVEIEGLGGVEAQIT